MEGKPNPFQNSSKEGKDTSPTKRMEAALDLDKLRTLAQSPEGQRLWDKEKTRNTYSYPVSIDAKKAQEEGVRLAGGSSPEEIFDLGPFICSVSPDSHFGPWRNAIDFLVPDGTPVVAAHAGIIIDIREGSDKWGPSPEYRDELNYLTLEHENGEYTQYAHLAHNSVGVNNLRVGSRVKAGDRIALVGKTGWTDRDHLHFLVFRNIEVGQRLPETPTYKSLEPQFSKPSWLKKLIAQ